MTRHEIPAALLAGALLGAGGCTPRSLPSWPWQAASEPRPATASASRTPRPRPAVAAKGQPTPAAPDSVGVAATPAAIPEEQKEQLFREFLDWQRAHDQSQGPARDAPPPGGDGG